MSKGQAEVAIAVAIFSGLVFLIGAVIIAQQRTQINVITQQNVTQASELNITENATIGNLTIRDRLLLLNITNCDTLDTDASGRILCGADATSTTATLNFSSPWLYNNSLSGFFNSTYANTTYDTRYLRSISVTIPITNVTNLISTVQCSGTDKLRNVTINNSGLFGVCDTDASGGGSGGGYPLNSPWLFNTSTSGSFNDTYANATYDTRYVNVGEVIAQSVLSITIPANNVTAGTFVGADYLFSGNVNITGGFRFTNFLSGNISNATFPASTQSCSIYQLIQNATINTAGLVSGNCATVSQSWLSITNIPIANTTGSFPQNRMSIENIPIANTTGSFPQDRMSITIPANNVTAGTFPSGLFTFTGISTNNALVVNGSSLIVNGTSGFIGINTTTPTSQLTIAGHINQTQGGACVWLAGGGRICGNATCVTTYNPNGQITTDDCN